MPTLNESMIKVLTDIAKDAQQDATDFDGKPFDGKTVGEYFGYHGASIATLADILKEVITANEKLTEQVAELQRSVDELTKQQVRLDQRTVGLIRLGGN